MRTSLSILIVFCLTATSTAVTVTVAPNTQAGLQSLAETITDTTGGVMSVVVGSATKEVNDGSGTSSSQRSLGSFASGTTPNGTPLPAINAGSPPAAYSGGIDTDAGVCLCTGAVTDADTTHGSHPGRGIGVEGPNNGISFVTNGNLNEGEISEELFGVAVEGIIDADFNEAVFNSDMATDPDLMNSSDPTVLQFDVRLIAPGYLRISTVFGSDEYPDWIAKPFNDSFAILVKSGCKPYENIAVFRTNGAAMPFSLQTFAACEAPHFKENQVAPQPSLLQASDHAIKNQQGQYNPAIPHYDHEFGGFTAKRTWETECPLPPGFYTVKIVIQDVSDNLVDSALFVEHDSLKLYDFLVADFDLEGDIDNQDYWIWNQNDGLEGAAKFTDGDANGDCNVDYGDLRTWHRNYGQTGGHRDLRFDFDRDGVGGGGHDFLLWQQNLGMTDCASRFEGDSNGDGAVDGADNPWSGNSSAPADPCGGGGQQAAMALGGEAATAAAAEEEASEFDAVDMDEDGDIDSDDATAWLASLKAGASVE